MSTMIQTKVMLDQMQCSNPKCKHDSCTLHLNQKCHPKCGVDIVYVKDSGVLQLFCIVCGRHIANIAVSNPEGGN